MSLREAHRLAPGDPRIGLVYALALEATGKVEPANQVLRAVLKGHPYDADALVTLSGWLERRGRRAEARPYAERLLELRTRP